MFTNHNLSLTQSAFLLFIFAYTNLIQAQITSPSSRPSKAMVLIPEGIFTMGSDIGPSDEKPKHDVFVKSCKKHNCSIKSYNMDLEKFVNTTNKKFDLIILRNVIQFIGHDELIKQCKKIVKKNAFIIIQNAKAEPDNWVNKELNKYELVQAVIIKKYINT